MSRKKQERVFRPLGLTIAILSAVVLFSGWSLLKLYIAWRLNAGVADEGVLYGAVIPFDILTKFTGLMGFIVLVTAVFAWIGKPQQARFYFQGAVLITAAALISETVFRSTSSNPSNPLVISSGEEAIQNVLQCQVPLQITVALYIIWYCNRAPARAFYRQEPMQVWHEEQPEDTDS